VGYDISPLSRAKFKILTTSRQASVQNLKFNSREWRNIVTHMGTEENLFLPFFNTNFISIIINVFHILTFALQNKRAIYLDGKISLAHARCTHLSQVIKLENKILYTVDNALDIVDYLQ
jgi:flagellar biosynthesis regulator FlaF